MYWFFTVKAWLRVTEIPKDVDATFIVSIASYPKRDPLLPAVFEALSRQVVKPKRWILVLSEEDYPKGLPKHLSKLQKLGIDILWVRNNPYAVKKLIPVIDQYPNLGVVTLDDDMIYHPSLLAGLIVEVSIRPDSVIGYIGKAMVRKGSHLHMYYREAESASYITPSEQLYLIGWGGIYYPPDSLDRRAFNMNAVHRIVPGRGSDMWFWAAAHAANTKQICLGAPVSYNLGVPIPQNEQTKPKDLPGEEIMLERFNQSIDYFGIRERLLNTLPSAED